MAGTDTNGSKPRQLALAMRARHKGRQFVVNLKAVKLSFGLIESPCVLEVGDLMVLQPVEDGDLGKLQLYGKVTRAYEPRHAYSLEWEKVVSPAGMSTMLEFLQTKLGVAVRATNGLEQGIVDGQVVYYDFRSGEFKSPAAQAGFQAEKTPPPVQGGPDDFSAPSVRNRMPPPKQEEIRTVKAAGTEESPDDVVEMFGVRMSRASWEQLEKIQFTGHSPTGDASRRGGNSSSSKKTGGPSQPGDPADKPGVISKFFKKIANKLSDKD